MNRGRPVGGGNEDGPFWPVPMATVSNGKDMGKGEPPGGGPGCTGIELSPAFSQRRCVHNLNPNPSQTYLKFAARERKARKEQVG